ncbi:SKIP/SNW domain protein (macronuclear) [Tetrahymena thermophila SB210]|uniref:SKIP/SNW domain protein n=1 Tax=Tetrahymena thermophila (strain SB210) TaxID=312017 RepID=Q22DI1_TETTS|nr:SKIP/SNW domain protein [Tetrahymena thermophila SB210]EAR83377.1 SKIP/SNW domain protein [Tetrahymena thermophila SB210]|eukprot:XP_001031040.1 SKIP/SNW domain protein [Tetrahymena thermophila SB210]
MIQPYKQGKDYQHNFRNRYLDEDELAKPSQEVAQQITNHTQQQLQTQGTQKTFSTNNKVVNSINKKNDVQYISYTPHNQAIGTNAGASQRIIKMHERQVDPLAPAQFKHKKVAQGPPSPPTTIMHSPPRKLTQEDQLNWKIPPCISNWKNAKGYTIPLEMRLKADGRTQQQHTINDKFAMLNNSLYVAEREARKELEERNKLIRTMAQTELKKQEEEFRKQAQEAREKSNKLLEDSAASLEQRTNNDTEVREKVSKEDLKNIEEIKRREQMRYIEKRELERQLRLENAGNKKAKQVRDQERDISEKVALGQAQPTQSKEVMFDQRLFNQNSGLDAGFGSDDENKLYDKPLFADRSNANIYRNNNEINLDDDEDDDKPADITRVVKAPARTFDGANKAAGNRSRPVEFEKEQNDYFGMDSLITDKVQKKLKKD